MAVTYGFYDSLNHDRLYNAQQMSAIFDGIINDGVFMSVGNQFHTVAGTGMQVIVKSGRAWFDSTWTLNDAEYPLSIDAADVLLTRIDAVVLEVNSEVATRANTIKVVKGTPASTPAKPTLTNTTTIHQHALAYVTVAKNITAITNSMIEIVVGKTETPYVTAILQTTDITDLYNQWEDYFQTWFDTVRGTLDGDVALNLQNQITSLRRETLKNTTPPIIGLPASATPDDMFQALAKTGDLHVWRKTVTTAQEIPAGYTLGDTIASLKVAETFTVPRKFTVKVAASISVDDAGTITMNNPTSSEYGFEVSSPEFLGQQVAGKFVQFSSTGSNMEVVAGTWFFETTASASFSNRTYYITKAKPVTGYPLTPAGTTTTYPVSTNPNAYQEGSDAKEAGYTLGEVVSGNFQFGYPYSSNTGFRMDASASVSVDDNGNVSLAAPITTKTINKANVNTKAEIQQLMLGKYVIADKYTYPHSDDIPGGIVIYIPSDATINMDPDAGSWRLSKYQPVTGYAAIPAGTTIEYLGKLGNKASMQVVSYVGTGTYGQNNPQKVSVDFKINSILYLGYKSREYGFYHMFSGNQSRVYVNINQVSTVYEHYIGFHDNGEYVYGKKSQDEKTFFWYSSNSAGLNSSGNTYYFLVIG